jgi:hypothetical protein
LGLGIKLEPPTPLHTLTKASRGPNSAWSTKGYTHTFYGYAGIQIWPGAPRDTHTCGEDAVFSSYLSRVLFGLRLFPAAAIWTVYVCRSLVRMLSKVQYDMWSARSLNDGCRAKFYGAPVFDRCSPAIITDHDIPPRQVTVILELKEVDPTNYLPIANVTDIPNWTHRSYPRHKVFSWPK